MLKLGSVIRCVCLLAIGAALHGQAVFPPAASSSGGSGTVTSTSVVTANGVSGSVATATTTPAITLTLTPALSTLAPIASPTFTGTVTIPNGGILGTPTSGTATNLVGLPLTTGVTGILPLANGGTNCAAPYPVISKTTTYQVLATDFTCLTTIIVPSGTFTVTLVASGTQPVASTWLKVMNYGTGVVTIARSGQNINGATTSITLQPGTNLAPTVLWLISDGTNYFAHPEGGQTISTIGTTNYFMGLNNGGAQLSSGVENTAFGYNTFSSLSASTLSNNTAFGAHTLEVQTGGGNNSAFGDDAGRSISTGLHNTCIGKDACEIGATIQNETAVGEGACDQTTANSDTCVGFHAGLNNSTNTSMILIGSQADASPTTGLDHAGCIGADCVASITHVITIGRPGSELAMAGGYISAGTPPTITGCGTISAQHGGITSGDFTTNTTGTCAAAFALPTAPTGWSCFVTDITKHVAANIMLQSVTSATGCTVTGTTAASDVLTFHAFAY